MFTNFVLPAVLIVLGAVIGILGNWLKPPAKLTARAIAGLLVIAVTALLLVNWLNGSFSGEKGAGNERRNVAVPTTASVQGSGRVEAVPTSTAQHSALETPPATSGAGEEGYRRQENVSWGLHTHTSCGSWGGSWVLYDLDVIGLKESESDGEHDIRYRCESGEGSISPEEGAIGILDGGEGRTLPICRNAARANPHPSGFGASVRSQREAGLVVGGALCVETNQGRILLLVIEKIIPGRGDVPAPTLRGKATIWDPV